MKNIEILTTVVIMNKANRNTFLKTSLTCNLYIVKSHLMVGTNKSRGRVKTRLSLVGVGLNKTCTCLLQIVRNANLLESWRHLSLECVVTLAETGL